MPGISGEVDHSRLTLLDVLNSLITLQVVGQTEIPVRCTVSRKPLMERILDLYVIGEVDHSRLTLLDVLNSLITLAIK